MTDTVYRFMGIAAMIVSLVAVAGMLSNFQNLETVPEHSHPTLPPAEPFDDSDLLTSLIQLETKLDDQKREYTREIVAVKLDLQNAQLGTGDAQKDKLDVQTGTGTTPKLTIILDSDEFIRGEIIWISGTGEPLQPIQATITDPNLNKRFPNASVDKLGSFKIAYTTDFDSLIGTYTVFVRSQGESSQTLSFVLKE